jgi:hypothetical protein
MSTTGHTSAGAGSGRARVVLVLVLAGLGVDCSLGGKSDSSDPASTSGTAGAGAAGFQASGTAGSTTGTAGSSVSTGAGGAPGAGTAGTGSGTAGAGTAGAATGSAGTTGTAGATGGTAGAGGGFDGGSVDAGTDAGVACSVSMTAFLPDPAQPGSFVQTSLVPNDHFEAGPSAVLRLVASVNGYAGALPVKWHWIVSMSPLPSMLTPLWTPVDDTGSSVDVSIAAKGTYSLEVRIDGTTCDSGPSVIMVGAPQAPSFLFRVTPPSASQLPTRDSLVKAVDISGAPQTLDLGPVDGAEVVSLAPLDARSVPIPSYIRITSPSFGFELEGYTGQGALIASLATTLTYNVLVVPDSGMAPLLVSGMAGQFSSKLAAIGPGTAVTGRAKDGNGQPVVGARVILVGGDRPSTVGVSGADGSFSLATREGPLSAEIAPPVGSGLPQAHVAAGIALAVGATDLDLLMTWAKIPSASLTVTVSGAGAVPVAGARVRADLAGTLPAVGTLTVNGVGGGPHAATGTAHGDGVTDAQGIAHLGLLPTGMYHLIVAPPDGLAQVAITLADVMLPGSGASPQVSLAAPVTLAGTLQPPVLTAGTKVTAIDRGLLAAATLPTATVGASGTYALALAPGRSYELLVEPAAGQPLGRSVVAIVPPGGGARTDTVPAALTWPGVVTGAGRPVAGAHVQVFCAAPSTWCLDSTLAVAQGTTRADGTLTLVLPKPP